MNPFRVLLVALWIGMVTYTVIVVANHGWNLFAVFFGDIRAMAWPGQFNVDFLSYLLLSGLWLMWRHEFSPLGIVLGIVGTFGGAVFLTAYVLIVSFSVNGNVAELLLGTQRARRMSAT